LICSKPKIDKICLCFHHTAGPHTGAATYTTTNTIHHGQSNPLNILRNAYVNGESLWKALTNNHPNIDVLIDLAYILEDHIKTVTTSLSLYDNISIDKHTQSLISFYQSPELYKPKTSSPFAFQHLTQSSCHCGTASNQYQNHYDPLRIDMPACNSTTLSEEDIKTLQQIDSPTQSPIASSKRQKQHGSPPKTTKMITNTATEDIIMGNTQKGPTDPKPSTAQSNTTSIVTKPGPTHSNTTVPLPEKHAQSASTATSTTTTSSTDLSKSPSLNPTTISVSSDITTPTTTTTTTTTKQESMTQPTYAADTSVNEVFQLFSSNTPKKMAQSNTTNTLNDDEDPDTQQKHMRINIVRYQYAIDQDMNTSQLYKSFMLTLKTADPTMIILPIASTKQHYSPLKSTRQIEALTPPQLHLYFLPWRVTQLYSLTGYIHICTTLSLEDLMAQEEVSQWLDSKQYYLKLCTSQDEEMTIVGALCYGSLFTYRNDLLKSILTHPQWVSATKDCQSKIILDLVVKPFHGSSKSTDMIFVRAELSKKDEARHILQNLYDGTNKSYPRGEMLLMIPIVSKLEDEFTPDQRDKFIYNHEKYLGNEDCTAIYGLGDLNTMVTLCNKTIVSLRTLLKGIPSPPGASKLRMFHFVDPNATQMCTLVTFQKNDHPLIAQALENLQNTILSLLAPNQKHLVLKDPDVDIWFVNAYYKNRGKFIKIHDPSPEHMAFIHCSNNMIRPCPRSDTEFYGGIVFFLLYQARKYVLTSWYCNSFILSHGVLFFISVLGHYPRFTHPCYRNVLSR
jgi:hypothetical protein